MRHLNKLEVGMYVRTDKTGIKKIYKIDNNKTKYKYLYKLKNQDDDGCIDLGILSDNNIIKARFDIINLIEVGDYVNGERIISIIPIDICGNEVLDNQHIFYKDGEIFEEIFEKDIKTVVTKEQFESMSYRIGDEIA